MALKKNSKNYVYAIATAILIFLMVCTIVSALVTSPPLTLKFYGSILNNYLPFNSDFDYTMVANSTSYYIIAKNGTLVYGNPNPNMVFNKLGSYITGGGSAYVDCSLVTTTSDPYDHSYRPSMTLVNVSDSTFTFSSASIIKMGVGVGNTTAFTSCLLLTNCTNVKLINPNIDGQAETQGGLGSHTQGIAFIDCNNCEVDGATVVDVRMFGFCIWDFSTGHVASGIRNSKITYSGWNDYQIGVDNNTSNGYAINCESGHCSDVGISTYGYNCKIIGNYVHDIDGTTGGGGNAHGGIGVEDGAYNLIENNTVINSVGGIGLGSGWAVHSNIIRNNVVRNCAVGIAAEGVGSGQSNFNLITQNYVEAWGNGLGTGISLRDGAGNILSFNILVSTSSTSGPAITTNDGCLDTFIVNNTLTLNLAARQFGLMIMASNDTLVEGNSIQSEYGIYIGNSATFTKLNQNEVANCTIGVINNGFETLIA